MINNQAALEYSQGLCVSSATFGFLLCLPCGKIIKGPCGVDTKSSSVSFDTLRSAPSSLVTSITVRTPPELHYILPPEHQVTEISVRPSRCQSFGTVASVDMDHFPSNCRLTAHTVIPNVVTHAGSKIGSRDVQVMPHFTLDA